MSQIPDFPAEPGREHLRRALDSLPGHEPDDALWGRIAAHMDTEAAVAQALPELPAHEPDDDLWAVIVGRLDREAPAALTLAPAEPEAPVVPLHVAPAATPVADAPAAGLAPPARLRRLGPTRAWHWAASTAAAVLIMTLVWWPRTQPGEPAVATAQPAAPAAAQETISYGEEVLPAEQAAKFNPAASFDPLQAQGLAFIDEHCTSLPTVCQSAEFQELRTELSELEAEEQRLRQAARRFGSTPQLEQDRARVTTQKATVTRELIQLLIS